MSLGNFVPQDVAGLSALPTMRWLTAAGTTVINAGEPVCQTAAGSKYAIAAGDGTPVIGTDIVLGIAATTSTQTASADGEVYVYIPMPGVTFAGQAKLATAVDTQAEIDALTGKRVVWDLTAGVYTIDSAAGDSSTNGIFIEGGIPSTSTL